MNRRGFFGSMLGVVGAAKALTLLEKPVDVVTPKGDAKRVVGYDAHTDSYLCSDKSWIPYSDLSRLGLKRPWKNG